MSAPLWVEDGKGRPVHRLDELAEALDEPDAALPDRLVRVREANCGHVNAFSTVRSQQAAEN